MVYKLRAIREAMPLGRTEFRVFSEFGVEPDGLLLALDTGLVIFILCKIKPINTGFFPACAFLKSGLDPIVLLTKLDQVGY